MIASLLAAVALAQPVNSPAALGVSGDASEAALRQALVAQLERNRALTLPEAPPLYHLRYHLVRKANVDLEASFGAIVKADLQPSAWLGVEVRVGEPAWDNTGFAGWENGFNTGGLPTVVTDYALALAAWRTTDQSYKEAVEQFARKSAQIPRSDDMPPDYVLTGPTKAIGGEKAVPADPKRLEGLAKALSAVFKGHRDLTLGHVVVGHSAGSIWTVDLEGTQVENPVIETSIRASVAQRAADGSLVTDQRLWTVRDADGLPAEAAMVADLGEMVTDLEAIAKAKPLAEEYVGPVLLRETAATDLFRYLLVPQLEGTPAERPFESWLGDLGGSGANSDVRLGRRVLPPGFSVTDDPQADKGHPAFFTHDMEGTPSQAVELVKDGIVGELLMSRIPRKGYARINGHARGFPPSRPQGKASIVTVSAGKALSEKALHKKALQMAKAYGRDWYLAIDRLQEPYLAESQTGISLFSDDAPGTVLPHPVVVRKVYADGHDELFRNASFEGVQRFALRDITGVGPSTTASYMAPFEGSYEGIEATEGLPTRITAPSVLIGELEIVPVPGDLRKVPVLAGPE